MFEVIAVKKKILKILSYILVAVLASALTLAMGQPREGQTKLDELQSLLSEYYIGEMDPKAIEDGAAQGMVNALGDRWSYYMTAEEYLTYQDTMSNSYVGIGVTIRQREDGQGLDVVSVEADSGADQAGVVQGDVLTAVDGKNVFGMTTNEVASLVRGEEGTMVSITLLRGEQELMVQVQRRRMKSVVATGTMLEDGIGLVTIENFDQRCASETIAIIEQLRQQGATKLIFDVRNNPGGYQTELVELLDYLLPEGPLFRAEDYRGATSVDESDANYLDMPMAVLVNLHSYSAAEFFAAALSEYEAAQIVGEKTYGKGYFQSAFELSDGSAVNLSIGKYRTPNGNSLVGVGVTPDVEVPVDEQTASLISAGQLPPEEDPQIQAAVNVLKNP